MNVTTGATTAITNPLQFAGAPAFSPDGTEIAYNARAAVAGKPAGLDVMSASGTFIRQVVAPPQANVRCGSCGTVNSAWSPDGKKILFDSPDAARVLNLFTVDAGGGAITAVSPSGVDITASSWAPVVTTCTVPKRNGQTLAKAKILIRRAGCVLGNVTGPKKNTSTRHVIKQNPRANKDVATGTKINLQIR